MGIDNKYPTVKEISEKQDDYIQNELDKINSDLKKILEKISPWYVRYWRKILHYFRIKNK